MLSRLQYISQGSTQEEQINQIRKSLDAGCDWIQLRFKTRNEKELTDTAEKVKKICDSYKSTFIVNDNVAVAKKVDASGVHLGLTDMSIMRARTILGPDKIIGGTANTMEDVLLRVQEKCNYIGLGPFRFTTTKEKLSHILGLMGYEQIMKEMMNRKITIPVYAVGGIMKCDIESLLQTGIYGIAVSGAITNNPDKKLWIQNYNSLIHEKLSNCR